MSTFLSFAGDQDRKQPVGRAPTCFPPTPRQLSAAGANLIVPLIYANARLQFLIPAGLLTLLGTPYWYQINTRPVPTAAVPTLL